MSHGTFNWNELNVRDVEKAKTFYAKTMGWSFDAMPMPDGAAYTMIKNGEDVIGGMLDISGKEFEGIPACWFTYIEVDDVDARLKVAVENGAQVIRQPWDVPQVGRIAILAEPEGTAVGWITPAQQ